MCVTEDCFHKFVNHPQGNISIFQEEQVHGAFGDL